MGRKELGKKHFMVARAFMWLAEEALLKIESEEEFIYTVAELAFKAAEHALVADLLLKTSLPVPTDHQGAVNYSKKLNSKVSQMFVELYDMYRLWSYRLQKGVEQPVKPVNLARHILHMVDARLKGFW